MNMQGHCKTYFLQDNLNAKQKISETKDNDTTLAGYSSDVFGMAELVAGYMDCMEEALRYLKEVEQYAEDHPAVLGLRQHLAVYRQQLITTQTIHCKENIPTNLDTSP